MLKSNVLPISLQLIELILELFLQCGIFDFVFILYITVDQLTTPMFYFMNFGDTNSMQSYKKCCVRTFY